MKGTEIPDHSQASTCGERNSDLQKVIQRRQPPVTGPTPTHSAERASRRSNKPVTHTRSEQGTGKVRSKQASICVGSAAAARAQMAVSEGAERSGDPKNNGPEIEGPQCGPVWSEATAPIGLVPQCRRPRLRSNRLGFGTVHDVNEHPLKGSHNPLQPVRVHLGFLSL
jgi:hypothetical protein